MNHLEVDYERLIKKIEKDLPSSRQLFYLEVLKFLGMRTINLRDKNEHGRVLNTIVILCKLSPLIKDLYHKLKVEEYQDLIDSSKNKMPSIEIYVEF